MSMKTKLFIYFLSLPTLFWISSCSKINNEIALPVNSTYIANLNRTGETPPDSSLAAGKATFTFDPSTNRLSGTITFSGFTTPTVVAQIQQGSVGIAGAVIFTIEATGGFTSPIMWTSPALTSTEVDDLVGGNYYLNISTQAYPNGEISGQLILQNNPPPVTG